MKQQFGLLCRNGYGELVTRRFEARNVLEARTIAKNFMKHNFIKQGYLITKSGKTYLI